MLFKHLIGIDEVGRGPIAGPLCVGACALVRTHASAFYANIRGIRDSKQLLPEEREAWAGKLRQFADAGYITTATAFISEKTIDQGGMARALRDAVGKVLSELRVSCDDSFIFLDGSLRAPSRFLFQETIIGGDETDALIAAASIVAKVRRDRYMTALAKRYPLYGFDEHKGYGTRKHYAALRKYGPCEIHRKSFLKSLIKNP